MANENKTLYCGMTNNLVRRVLEHKQGKIKGFTQKYNLKKCVYYEYYESVKEAIIREKQLKNMKRAEKIELIESRNATWTDISSEILTQVDDLKSVPLFKA